MKIEKKEYESPKMTVVELNIEAPLLSGSDNSIECDDCVIDGE